MMFKERTAVITGASRGIGRAIAIEIAKNGANIAIVFSENECAAAETAKIAEGYGVIARIYKCDVSEFSQSKAICNDIINDFSRIDILINNAGITKDGLILAMSEADFDTVIGVNLKGAFNFTKHLFRCIMKSPCGRIINISSVFGVVGNSGQANYVSSKAGLIGFTKAIAKELASRGVTCNAIAPGFIETDMTAVLSEEMLENVRASIPLKRIGKAEEVASLAVFLASDSASYITGDVIQVDGGMYI